MDSKILSEIILKELKANCKVVFPHFGTLEYKEEPSYFSKDEKTLYPPTIKIEFVSSDVKDNDTLYKEYSNGASIDLEDSKNQIDEYVNKLIDELNKGNIFEICGVGTFKKESGIVLFEAGSEMVGDKESYGLEEIDLEKMYNGSKEEGSLENVDNKENVLVEGDVVDVILNDRVDSTGADTQEISVEEQGDIAGNKEKELIEAEAGRVEMKEVKEKEIVENKVNKDKQESISITLKILLWLVAIIVVITILIFLIYLFKDSLSPVLQKILYTKEELEIINYKI